MKKISLIAPGRLSGRLSKMVEAATSGIPVEVLPVTSRIPALKNKKILFAADLDQTGVSIPLLGVFRTLYKRGRTRWRAVRRAFCFTAKASFSPRAPRKT